MATSDTTLKLKADISSLKSQMQAAARQVKLANSEFKAASAGLDNWANSADGLEAKVKQLNTVLKAQKTQVALAKEEWEKTKQAYGENSAEADRAEVKLNNLKAAVAKTEKELGIYETDLKDCQEGTGRFADELDESKSSMDGADASLQKLDDGFTVMKGVMADLVASGIKAMIDGLKDLANAAKEAYSEFDTANDTMVAKTGATGEALGALRDTYVDVSKNIVADSEDIASAIGQINTKFGLTGDELQSFSEKMLKFSQLNNTDVSTSIDNVYSAMTAWGISMEDADEFLDLLNATGQRTGANVDKLTSSLTTNAASLKDMGFTAEEATSFLGKLEMAGISSDTVMQGLKKAFTNAAQEGKSTKEMLAELQESMTSTKSDTEKTVDAIDLFGNRAGPAIAEACKSGRLDFEDLGKAMEDYEDNLDTTYDATLDASDKIALAFQGMKAEAGQYLKEMMEESGDEVESVLDVVKDAFKTVMDALKSNAPEIKNTIKNVITTIAKLIKGLVNNFSNIVAIVKDVGKVLIASFVVTKIASFVTAVVGLVRTFQTLKTATEAATTAQKLLNLAQSANVIGAVTAAVAGLAAAVLWLCSSNDKERESIETLNEYEQMHADKVMEMTRAYNEMDEARKESMAAVQQEYGYYDELASELETIVDANGKVKEGYEDRASFILSTLNEALGTEMTLQDGIIQGYDEEIGKIHELIDAKKAEAILQTNEEAYTMAIQNRNEALQEYITTEGIYKQNVAEMNDLEAKRKELTNMTADEYAKLNGIVGTAAEKDEAYQKALGQTEKELQATKGAVGEAHMAYDQARRTYENYEATIKNYEGLSAAIISGDADKINAAMNNMVSNFKTAETSTVETLQKQVSDYKENLESLKKAIDEGTPGVTQEMVDQAQSMVDAANKELAKGEKMAETQANNTAQRYATTLGSDANVSNVLSNSKKLQDNAVQGVTPDGREKTAGEDFGSGYIAGLNSNMQLANTTGYGMSSTAVDGLNSGQDSHSPSKATQTSGENFGQGYVNGINNKQTDVWNAALALAKKALEALKVGQQEGSPSKLTRKSGRFFVEGFRMEIENGAASVVKAATKLAVDATTALADVEFDGSTLRNSFTNGVKSLSNSFSSEISGSGKLDLGIPSMTSLSGRNGAGVSNTTIINNYEMNQNNYSPKSLNALQTYQYERQQMELLKAAVKRG